MSDQSQTISYAFTRIELIQLKPVQDIVLVIPAKSGTIQYIVGKLIPGKPEIPAVATIPGRGQILESGTKGQPNYQPYVPAIDSIIGTPAVSAVPDAVTPVVQGTIEMTDAEWNAWGTQDDDTYRTSIVVARLGLTIKSI